MSKATEKINIQNCNIFSFNDVFCDNKDSTLVRVDNPFKILSKHPTFKELLKKLIYLHLYYSDTFYSRQWLEFILRNNLVIRFSNLTDVIIVDTKTIYEKYTDLDEYGEKVIKDLDSTFINQLKYFVKGINYISDNNQSQQIFTSFDLPDIYWHEDCKTCHKRRLVNGCDGCEHTPKTTCVTHKEEGELNE